MSDFINNLTVAPVHSPTLSISTSPRGASFNYPILGATYTSPTTYYTPIGWPITFTANAVFSDPNILVVDWEWTFGDGGEASGQVVTHTYKAAFPDCPAILRVVDSNQNEWYMRQQIYLQHIDSTLIQRAFPAANAAIRSSRNTKYIVSDTPVPVVISQNRIPAL